MTFHDISNLRCVYPSRGMSWKGHPGGCRPHLLDLMMSVWPSGFGISKKMLVDVRYLRDVPCVKHVALLKHVYIYIYIIKKNTILMVLLMFYGFSMMPITSYRHFWTKPWATEFVFMATDEYLSKFSVAGDVVENPKKSIRKIRSIH